MDKDRTTIIKNPSQELLDFVRSISNKQTAKSKFRILSSKEVEQDRSKAYKYTF